MFSEKDLVARSKEDMAREVEELLTDAERLKEQHETAPAKRDGASDQVGGDQSPQTLHWLRSSGWRQKSCETAPERC